MATRHHVFETPGPVLLRLAIPEGELRIETGDAPRVEVEAEALRGGQDVVDALRIEATERGGRHEVVVEAPAARFGVGRRRAVVGAPHLPGGHVRRDVARRRPTWLRAGGSATSRCAPRPATSRCRTSPRSVSRPRAATCSCARSPGDVSVKTTSGDVLARSIGGDLVVAVVSGDVKVSTVGGDCRVNTVSGDIEIGELGGGATINGVSSDVELGVAAGRRLWLDVRSATGDVRSDLDVGDTPGPDDARVSEITVRTVSGDVRLRRARA